MDIDEAVEQSHGYYPALKFDAPGDEIEGEILDAWMAPKKKYRSGQFDLNDDGTPKMQLVLNLAIDGEDGPELRTWYTKFAAQLAIFDAVRRSGGKLSQGGHIKAKRVADLPPKQVGYDPTQQFIAEFTPRTTSAVDRAVNDSGQAPPADNSWFD